MLDHKRKLSVNKIFENVLNKTSQSKILIIVLTGILLMVITLPSKKTGSTKNTDTSNVKMDTSIEVNTTDYETYLEQKLEKLLAKVEGVGKTEVLITFKGSSEKILAKDSQNTKKTSNETDSAGGSRITDENSQDISHIYYDSGNGDTPYIIMENMPEVSGVLVVCEGGADKQIVTEITGAVEGLLGVPIHKIKVMKMNQIKD